MWMNIFFLFVIISSVSYAGDYGRKSSSVDAYQAKMDAQMKLMKDFVKDLPKEAKSTAMKNYVTNNAARNSREMNAPGSSMQEYVQLTNRLAPKLTNISDYDKPILLSNYHYALLFTNKTQAEADDIFIKTMQNTALTNNNQRNLALRDALLK